MSLRYLHSYTPLMYSFPERATQLGFMGFAIILKLLGVLLMIFSTFMLPPIGVAMFYGDGGTQAFITGFIATFAAGLACWWPFRHYVRG